MVDEQGAVTKVHTDTVGNCCVLNRFASAHPEHLA